MSRNMIHEYKRESGCKLIKQSIRILENPVSIIMWVMISSKFLIQFMYLFKSHSICNFELFFFWYISNYLCNTKWLHDKFEISYHANWKTIISKNINPHNENLGEQNWIPFCCSVLSMAENKQNKNFFYSKMLKKKIFCCYSWNVTCDFCVFYIKFNIK